MAWKTSLTGTPSVRAFSRSSSTFTWGYVGSNAVKSEANSGRWRAAARNARVWAPSWSTVSEPLRSWSRKLKPAAAPKPLMRSEEHTLNSSHLGISYAVFCLKKKKNRNNKDQDEYGHSSA